jgi:hypothetical protein
MKYALVIVLIIAGFGCGTRKGVALEDNREEGTAADAKSTGIVYVSLKGCPVLIETEINGETMRLYPVNLDEEYKKDGLRISFTFAPSRAMQPEGCTLIDRVVSIENVLKIDRK